MRAGPNTAANQSFWRVLQGLQEGLLGQTRH